MMTTAPLVRRVLHVTAQHDSNGWAAYVHRDERAVVVARADFNGLDDLRYYAEREGYDGIIIGTPCVPWADRADCDLNASVTDN